MNVFYTGDALLRVAPAQPEPPPAKLQDPPGVSLRVNDTSSVCIIRGTPSAATRSTLKISGPMRGKSQLKKMVSIDAWQATGLSLITFNAGVEALPLSLQYGDLLSFPSNEEDPQPPPSRPTRATLQPSYVGDERAGGVTTVETSLQTTTQDLEAAGTFLDRVQTEFAAGNETEAIDLVYDTIDGLLLAHDYPLVSWVLQTATQSVEAIAGSILLSLLTATLQWHDILAEDRTELFGATRKRFLRDEGPEETDALLVGLDA